MSATAVPPDDELRAQGVALLEEHLGPLRALRFLALISREPFDYQTWRDSHLASKSLEEVIAEARRAAQRG